MSTYSLDSLEKYSTDVTKFMTKSEMVCNLQLSCDNTGEDWDSGKKDAQVVENSDKDKGFNESSFVATVPNRDRDIVKFCENAIIARGGDDGIQEFCSRVEKLPATRDTRTHFRTGCAVAKKFNVVQKRRSSSLGPSSEFRRGDSSSLIRKQPSDVVGFMKAYKKPAGNVQHAISGKSKKPVSYLELYLGSLGVDRRQCISTPVGSTMSICDDRSDERTATDDYRDGSLVCPRGEIHDVGFHRDSQDESRETRSCELLDSFVTTEREFNETRDHFSPGSYSDFVQPINRRKRVSYEPYDIEDYKNLSVPRADRSLGPDRNEMESKGEWLMRRRTYGAYVSALNRQRIQRRAEKLKHSRRADSQKLLLYPASMDLENPSPASKIEVTPGREKKVIPARSPKRRANVNEQRQSVGTMEKLSSIVRKKELSSISSKRKAKTKGSSRVIGDLYETSSDSLDDESMQLRNLRQRHLEEKKTIDRLLKRVLCG